MFGYTTERGKGHSLLVCGMVILVLVTMLSWVINVSKPWINLRFLQGHFVVIKIHSLTDSLQ